MAENDELQRALARASGREWPETAEQRIDFAIKDRRTLAREVYRLTALLSRSSDGSDRGSP